VLKRSIREGTQTTERKNEALRLACELLRGQVRGGVMRMRRLKLILLFRSIPNDDIKLRELLERFGLIERFTPYVSGGRGALRGDEAREWLERRRNEAIAEVTLAVATIAMLAAIVAALRS
jgi:hypothetical protein